MPKQEALLTCGSKMTKLTHDRLGWDGMDWDGLSPLTHLIGSHPGTENVEWIQQQRSIAPPGTPSAMHCQDDDEDCDNVEDNGDDEDGKDDDGDDDEDADDVDADLDWVSDVLPGGDEGHADEEDDEGGSVVKLERKVVNRSRIRLPEKK